MFLFIKKKQNSELVSLFNKLLTFVYCLPCEEKFKMSLAL